MRRTVLVNLAMVLCLALFIPEPGGFMVRAQCFQDITWLVMGGLMGDFLTYFVYCFAVPLLVVFVVGNEAWDKISHLPKLKRDILLWALFIWACGFNHLVESMDTFWSAPRTMVVVKILMATVSFLALTSSWSNRIFYLSTVRGFIYMGEWLELKRTGGEAEHAEEYLYDLHNYIANCYKVTKDE